MPVLTIKTNVEASKIPEGFKEETVALLSEILKEAQEGVFVIVDFNPDTTFGGEHNPCALCALESVGMFQTSHVPPEEIERVLGPHLCSKLGLEMDRMSILYNGRLLESNGKNNHKFSGNFGVS
ncbi:macrophage migration inhibitory factor homolog [Lineus longissimus]|uniref:macrophage migration inhibitory factor homolog n=1 Tax=Lineus longissimus TaxID=88925 RepID=UPI002B4D304D